MPLQRLVDSIVRVFVATLAIIFLLALFVLPNLLGQQRSGPNKNRVKIKGVEQAFEFYAADNDRKFLRGNAEICA